MRLDTVPIALLTSLGLLMLGLVTILVHDGDSEKQPTEQPALTQQISPHPSVMQPEQDWSNKTPPPTIVDEWTYPPLYYKPESDQQTIVPSQPQADSLQQDASRQNPVGADVYTPRTESSVYASPPDVPPYGPSRSRPDTRPPAAYYGYPRPYGQRRYAPPRPQWGHAPRSGAGTRPSRPAVPPPYYNPPYSRPR